MFIKNKFEELAAFSWRGFEAEGRGFLLITSGSKNAFPARKDTFELNGSLLTGKTQAEYVSCAAIEACGADYPTDNTAEMVETYDTTWEIVVVIEREDGDGWGSYRYVGPVKPAVAYNRLKKFLDAQPTTASA